MTEPRTVLLDIHHHHDPDGTSTCIAMRGAVITIGIGHDIDAAGKADLCAVLGRVLPLMVEVWAQPDMDGPMVYDLRGGSGA